MYRFIVFGGTTEGNEISSFMASQGVSVLVRVATEYGASRLEESEYLHCEYGRLSEEEMARLFNEEKPQLVVDATHPYAKEVTGNISRACETSGTEYLRLVRDLRIRDGAKADAAGTTCGCEDVAVESGDVDRMLVFDSIDEAVAYLNSKDGVIFATTGSKELYKYTAIDNYEKRVVARVLSTAQVAAECEKLGFRGENLICMQGPFSREMNIAMLKARKARYMVSKLSGAAGGFEEKLEAAREAGCIPVLIGRPDDVKGLTMNRCKAELCRRLGIKVPRRLSLVGIGTGSRDMLTPAALKAIDEAQLIMGADRMIDLCLEALPESAGKTIVREYRSESIKEYISAHPEYTKIAVVLSGDVGFYSGARKLTEIFRDTDLQLERIPGISSVIYFMSKIRESWDDALILSSHGVKTSLIPAIRDNYKVISILGRADDGARICRKLKYYGLEHVKVYLGEKLSYEDEKITEGCVDDFLEGEHDSLAVMTFINEDFRLTALNRGEIIRDEAFIRGRVPMTKYDVRGASLNRLAVDSDAVCYDIGAGTGSVSVEMAVKADRGRVFAIEKNSDAIELLKANRQKFACDNITVIEGLAPEAMAELPPPSHMFIGGSSGNMREIIETAIKKNPDLRVVINCIALESALKAVECAREFSQNEEEIEVSQLTAAEGNFIAGYTMMKGGNPIYIVSFGGRK